MRFGWMSLADGEPAHYFNGPLSACLGYLITPEMAKRAKRELTTEMDLNSEDLCRGCLVWRLAQRYGVV